MNFNKILNTIATLYVFFQDNMKTMAYYNISLDLKKKRYGEKSTEVLSLMMGIGTYYENLKIYDVAINDYYKKCLSIYKQKV